MTEQNKKRKWQNLLYLKCPNCNERLEDSRQYMACPTPSADDPTKSCFFISKKKIAEILLDESHPANYCLKEHEKIEIQRVITKLEESPDSQAGMA